LLNTSEPKPSELNTPEALITALRRQPVLVVLRAEQPLALRSTLEQLDGLGVRHVEIAWSPHQSNWSAQCRQLAAAFPALCFGAASVCSPAALQAVVDAGLSFAVSPVFQPALLQQAAQLGLTLVPGVFSPSEVSAAMALGCAMVKLFPAASVGPSYWRRLAGPLGPLPFCIAAGGLGPADLPVWLAAGVDAVALGGQLSDASALTALGTWIAAQTR
jgi:2-dehydro-3-deoxyphosphogluconate aldolase/(4S)-4-hydroxy-2-oxoglutarate aldolase